MERIDADGLDELATTTRTAATQIDNMRPSAVATLQSIDHYIGAAAVNGALERATATLQQIAIDLAVRAEGARVTERIFDGQPNLTPPNLTTALILVGQDPAAPATTFNANSVRISQLFALAGVMGPDTDELLAMLNGDEAVPPRYAINEWLMADYPDLAERRLRIAGELEVLVDRQAELRAGLAAEAEAAGYVADWSLNGGWVSGADLGYGSAVDPLKRRELATVEEEIALLVAEWQADAVDVEAFLAPMSVVDRDALVALVVIMTATIGGLPVEFGPYARAELARLRSDQAVARFMSPLGGDPQVSELGQTINALDPQDPSLVVAFLDGLVLGDISETTYPGGAGLANLLGLIVSGELVFGDVRDVIVGLERGNYGDAAFAAFGFIPFVSVFRRMGDAAYTTRQIRRVTRAFRRGATADTYVRAARVTRAGRDLAAQVLNDISKQGFTQTALDNGIDALATVMTRDELTRTLLELRRLDTERVRMVRQIDDLVASGTVPTTMLRQLEKTRNALNRNLDMDSLIGAIRDTRGIPVLEVIDGAGSLRVVQHDEKVEQALRSLENTFDVRSQLGESGMALVDDLLKPLLAELRAVTAVRS